MEKYYALIRQIEQLIRDRPLVKYVCPKVYREGISAKVKAYQRDPIPPFTNSSSTQPRHQHVIFDYFNTIVGSFLGRGVALLPGKWYARSVMIVSIQPVRPSLIISFTDVDFEGVFPH